MGNAAPYRALLAVLALAFFAVSLVILPIPFTRDQGIYAYNAWQWMSDLTPYKDTFGHKGPLLYFIYGIGLNISDGAMWGPNFLDILARLFTVLMVYCLGAKLEDRRAGIYGALVSALVLAGVFNSCWWNGQAETFMLPLMAASAVCACMERRPGTLTFTALAGVLAAQAAAIKTTGVIHAVFLWIWIGYAYHPGERLRASLALAIGFAAGLLPWALYFLAKGAITDLWECLFAFNSFHIKAAVEEFSQANVDLLKDRAIFVFNLVPAAFLLMLLPSEREQGRPGPSFALWWAAICALIILVQVRFFLYHFLVLIPAVAVLSGIGLSRLNGAVTGFNRAAAALVMVLVLLYPAWYYGRAYYLIADSYRTADYLRDEIGKDEYYARFSDEDENGVGDFNLLGSMAAAARLREVTPEGSKVLVFGYEPLVNYLSARPAPTRFEIDYPLTFYPFSERAEKYRAKWREQFLAELSNDPPAAILIVDNDKNAIEPLPSMIQAAFFEDFWSWLNLNYKAAGRVEDFHFYERKEAAR